MEILNGIVIPEVVIYLLGVLALLILWQYHHIQTLSGRIYAVDFWDVSGIRMFMHATATDGNACKACREANGRVFLPSLATKKNFSMHHRWDVWGMAGSEPPRPPSPEARKEEASQTWGQRADRLV